MTCYQLSIFTNLFTNGQQNDSRKHTFSVSNLNLYTTQYLDGESNLQQVLFRKKPFMKGDKLFNYNIDKVFWKCIEVYFYIDDMCMQSFMQLSNNKQHLCMSGCEPQPVAIVFSPTNSLKSK